MKIDEIKEIAKRHYIKTGKSKKADLIRAIQLSEGNQDCFGSSCSGECGQDGCLWREDCV
ncbi:MAG: SAP domain-containing protein [Geobacteraceae bacterium]|nr:SAP domain-containing protein [Geobacteraceae bacterium]NTW80409.1 SAP domain-containing protein [Geobacteraceae bacterium]